MIFRTSEAVDKDGVFGLGKQIQLAGLHLILLWLLRYFSSTISSLEIRNYIFEITLKIQNFRN